MFEINKPEMVTYWIAITGDIKSCGQTNLDQVTTSGAESFETFTDIMAFNARCIELGITNEGEL